MLSTRFEHGEVEAGTHVMFDCHGTIDLYCWDGGKTWVVDGEPQGDARRWSKATSAVAETLMDHGVHPRFHRLAVPDEHVAIGPPAALYAHYQLDAEGVELTMRGLLGPNNRS